MTHSRLIEADSATPSVTAANLARKLSQASMMGTLNGLPLLSPAPPTVSLSSGFTNSALVLTGSSIANARCVPTIKPSSQGSSSPVFNRDAFTFFGQPINQRGQINGNSQVSVQADLAVSGLSFSPFRVEFMVDCVQFEAQLFGNGHNYRLWVDGQPVTQRAQAGPSGTSSLYNLLVTFPSRDTRRITFDFTNGQGFAGINLGPLDNIWPSQCPIGPRLLVFGDSFVDGANGTNALDTWAFTLGLILGCRDIQTSGIGGTGFVATGGGVNASQSKSSYRSRLQTDVIAHSPDIVVVQGSVNDPNNSVTSTALAAEAALVYRGIRAGLPKVKLIATGITRTAGSLNGTQAAANDALRRTALQPRMTDLFIDAYPDYYSGASNGSGLLRNWFWGSGNTSSPAGNGNADLYMSNDGTHPSQAGHDYLALRVASSIINSGILG